MTAISVDSRLAIYELIARYSHEVDNYRGEGWADLFVESGKLISPVSAYVRREDFLRQAESLRQRGVRYRHIITNIYLDAQSNEEVAVAYAYGSVTEWSQVPASVLIFVDYRFDVVRHQGKWKFSEVHVSMPYNAELLAANARE